jgi:hypothetical protein
MIGKLFKSKIDGKIFKVLDLKSENNKEYYVLQEIKTGYQTTIGKGWFENGIMWNLEEVLTSKTDCDNIPT